MGGSGLVLGHGPAGLLGPGRSGCGRGTRARAAAASRPRADDSSDMWDDQEEDDDDEEDGLAGQLLSDILATSKYGEHRGRHQERGAPGMSRGLVYPCPQPCGRCLPPGPVRPDPPWLGVSPEEEYYEDDEEDDPDALKDPLYQVDLQVRVSRDAVSPAAAAQHHCGSASASSRPVGRAGGGRGLCTQGLPALPRAGIQLPGAVS